MKKPKTPTVVVVLSEDGLERSLIIAPEDDADLQERGYRLLAKVAVYLTMMDNCIREPNPNGQEAEDLRTKR